MSDPPMRMVVTLRNGVQIKAEVEKFSTDTGKADDKLRGLNWTQAARASVVINWLDIGEVAAVHAEYDDPPQDLEESSAATEGK